jgi:hypothetical protein
LSVAQRLALGFALCCAGCAATKVVPVVVDQTPGRLGPPARVYVFDFAVSPAEVSRNRGVGAKILDAVADRQPDEQEVEIGRKAAGKLATRIVKGIRKLGMAVERPWGRPPWGEDAVLIEGQFLNIDEGNRLARMVIGFGAGATEVETQVQVYDARVEGGRVLAEFRTSSKSGKKPGAAVTMGAAGAARGASGVATAGAVGGVSEALGGTIDSGIRRTGDEIVTQLAEVFLRQGWVSAEVADQVKKKSFFEKL